MPKLDTHNILGLDAEENIAGGSGEEEEMKSTEGKSAGGDNSDAQNTPKHETNRGSRVNGEDLRPRIFGKSWPGKTDVIGYMPAELFEALQDEEFTPQMAHQLKRYCEQCYEKYEVLEIIGFDVNRAGFPVDLLPSPLFEIVSKFSKFAAVPESMSFFTVATQLSKDKIKTGLNGNKRVLWSWI